MEVSVSSPRYEKQIAVFVSIKTTVTYKFYDRYNEAKLNFVNWNLNVMYAGQIGCHLRYF
jgi:hypothetical protein